MDPNSKTFELLEKFIKNVALKHIETLKVIHFEDYQPTCRLNNKEISEITKIVEEFIDPKNLPDIKKGIDDLLNHSEDIFKSNKYFTTRSSFTTEISENDQIPLVYDLLLAIFSNTTQYERQQYFHKLLETYFHHLQFNDKETPSIPKEEFEDQVKGYIPYVKLETILNASTSDQLDRTKILESVSELIEVILFPKLLREECYKIVSNKLGTDDYEFLKYEVNLLGERPGFLGDYYKIKISIKYHGEQEIIRCFAKYMPLNEVFRVVAKTSYEKEIFFYSKYIPLVESAGLKDLTDFLPKCFLFRINEYIILEDLSYDNYTTVSMNEPVTFEDLALAIKQLAKLHACSIIYEEKLSQNKERPFRFNEVEEYKPYIKEYLFSETEIEGGVMLLGAKTITSYLLDNFEIKDFSVAEIKEKTSKAIKKMYEDIKASEVYRNVICHGDMWGNNFLVKKGKDQYSDSCRLIDFQMMRYSSPVFELIFLLQINTNTNTRNTFSEKLINLYYEELKKHLHHYEVDIDGIYDYKTFLKACKHYKLSAICWVLIYAQLIFVPKEIMKSVMCNLKETAKFFTNDRTKVLDEAKKHDLFYLKIQESLEELCKELKTNDTL